MQTIATTTVGETTIYLKENGGEEYGVYEFRGGKPEHAAQCMMLDHALTYFASSVRGRVKTLLAA